MSEKLPAYHSVSPVSEPQAPPRALSIVHDWREIAEERFARDSNPEDTERDMQCHHWLIDHWDSIPEEMHGATFTVGGHRWNLLLYPNGAHLGKNGKDIAVYLKWKRKSRSSVRVQFILALSNHKYPTNYISRYARYRFDSESEVDWGFTHMASGDTIRLRDEQSNRPALLQDGKLRISVIVRVLKEDDVQQQQNEKYSSRQLVGFVPIRNISAHEDDGHCNAILQLLFCTNYFRRAIFYSGATECTSPLAVLQKIFYSLQYSSDCVDAGRLSVDKVLFKDLTNPIDCKDALQHKLLTERPELKKHYDAIFGITHKDRSSIDYSVTLSPKSNSLEASLSSYVSENELLFHTVPPVLHIQLKPSTYNEKESIADKGKWKAALKWKTLASKSETTRLTYPATIDLSPYIDAPPGDESKHEYTLHGVIVQSTSTEKYHTFIRPFPSTNNWYKFDNENVTQVEASEVFPDYSGASSVASRSSRSDHLPYMLSYIKTSKLHDMLIDVPRNNIPSNIAQWVYQGWKENQITPNHRVTIMVYTDDSLRNSKKMDLFDLDCTAATKFIFALSSDTFERLCDAISEQYYIPKSSFRLWLTVERRNGTRRPYKPFKKSHHSASLKKAFDSVFMDDSTETSTENCYRLYLEEYSGVKKHRSDILIFIKYFDIKQNTIRGLGHVIFNLYDKIGSITSTINAMAGQSTDTKLELYEVVSFKLIDKLNLNRTFDASEMQDGDLICAQPVLTSAEKEELGSVPLDPKSYYVSIGLMDP